MKNSIATVGFGGLGMVAMTADRAAAVPETSTDEKSVMIQRRIPIRHEVDVFVAGGGPSGVAASVAAARQGRSVFLAERQNCLGGMGTAGLLPLFMRFTDGVNFLAGGMGETILTRLQKAGGAAPHSDDSKTEGIRQRSIKAEVLKRVYDDLLLEASVRFAFDTRLIDLETKNDGVGLAVLAAKSGIFAVKAKLFIDCTGDGDLAAWAGAPFEKGDADGNTMAGTLCSLWANVDWDKAGKFGFRNQEQLLPEAFKDKVFTIEDRHLPGMYLVGNNIAGGNLGHTFGVDGTDERSVTQALVWARKLILEYERYYKEYLQGFENMELVTMASMLGIRETRRIMGDYVLNLDDYMKRAIFEDEIGRYNYAVDMHATKPGDSDYQKYVKDFVDLEYGEGESYGIPYRILVPKKLSNVLVAGRCVSTDRYLQGSIRVMPGCFITGQAAGVAAAIAAEKNIDTRAVSVPELQQRLKKMGAYLPNC
ncbi:MAG: FAD-dependent oxidoreductase [bacterium]